MIAALKEDKKYILLLFVAYTLSQGLVLIVSGLWYDDWCLVNLSNEGLRMWAYECGRPEFVPIISLMQIMPGFVYKMVIFAGHFIVIVCFFMIIKKCFCLGRIDALSISLLYMCMPVNDIRLERMVVFYSLGLCLFSLAFFIMVYKYESLNLKYRIVVIALYFFSYILNSLLCFMGLVWLYIIIKEKNLKRIIYKVDFFLIPFVFFFIKQVFFHTHGVYEMYNRVSLEGLNSALLDTFLGISNLAGLILKVFVDVVVEFPITIIAVFAIAGFIVMFLLKKGLMACKEAVTIESVRKLLKIAIVGLIALYVGLFPYVVVGSGITISGFDGRNSILVPFGFSMIIFAIIKFGLKPEFRMGILAFMIIVSSLYFISCYSDYQRIYYCDVGLQYYLSQNPSLMNYDIIGVIESDKGASNYMYNGMFEMVYGNESRLVENLFYTGYIDVSSYEVLIDREWYNMSSFNISSSDGRVDCVIVYSNYMSSQEALFARIKELFGKDISEDITNKSAFRVIKPSDDEFNTFVSDRNR